MSSVTEKYGKNLLNPLATNTNSANYKINELNNAISKFQKNASVTNDAAIIADLSVDVANKLENAKNYISDDVYKNIQNQLISYRSASNQQRINQEIRQNLIAKNKTNRANSSDIAKRKMILDDATALDLLELQQKQLRGVNVDSLVLSDMQKHLLGQETSESIYTQSNILENIANVAETPEQKAVREKYGLNDNITSKEIDELLIDVNRKIGDYDRIKGGMTLNEYEQNEYDNLINKRKELSNYKNEYLLPKEKSSEKLAEKKNAINTAKHDLIGLSFNERLELYNEAIANGDNEYAEYIKEHKYDDLSSYYDFVLALKYLKKDYQDLVVESLTGKIPESLIQKYVNEIERTGKLSHFEVDLNDVVTDSNSNDEFRSQISQKFQDIEDKIDKLERNEYYYAKHEYELEKLGIHGEEYVELIKENEDATSFGGRWDSKDKIREIEKEWISRGIMTQDEIDDLKYYIKRQYQEEKNKTKMKELYSGVTEYNDLQELGITIGSSPVTFGGNVLTLFDSIYQAGRELFGGEKRPINAYSDINASAQWAKTVREAVQADQSDAGKFFYGVGCSLLDMYVAIAASGGIGDKLSKLATGKAVAGSLTKNVTLASMSLNAGGGAALDAMEKTSNPYEVAAIGVSSAVFEALAEKLPLDNLFKIAGQEGKITASMILKAMGSQAVSEFGEEAATETANIIMEAIVLGDKSDWAQTVQDYIDKGYSESEARSKALVSMVGRVGMSGLAGAISGGFSGGGASTINYLAYNYSLNSTGKTLIKNNQVERLIELAETAGVDISAYNLEGKKGNYNAKAVGELYFEVMRNKSDAVSNALKEMGVSEADVAVVQNAIFREAFGQELSTEMQAKYNQYEDVIDNAMNDEASSLNVAANDYMLTSLLVEIPRSKVSNASTDVSETDSGGIDNSYKNDIIKQKEMTDGGVYNGEQYNSESDNKTGGYAGIQERQAGAQIDTGLAQRLSRLDGRENYRGTGVRSLSERIKKNLIKKNKTPIDLRSSESPASFYAAIGRAKANNSHGAYVAQHTVDEYSDMLLLMSEDENVGVAITPDGDIVSVFKNSDSSTKGAVSSILLTAIENGGVKLDNFHGGLSRMYEQHGFIPVARTAFVDEFAPDDWNYERDGRPDIVFWMHNGQTAEQVSDNIGFYEAFETLDDVPMFDSYDEAAAHRDSLIDNNTTVDEADYLDNETLESVEENEYDKTIRLMDGRAKPLTEAQAYVQSVGRALGYTVVIDDLSHGGRTASGKSFKGTTRGFFDGQTIYLHEGQTTFDAVVEIFKHEITHYSELNPEMYKKYAKTVFDSKVFENWISGKAKGRSHPARLGQYRQSIIDIYEANGKTLDPTAADREIIANFTSEMLFNEKGNTLERFINEVNSEDRNAISRFIHDFISWLKARLKGEKVSLKIVKLENRFAAVLRNVDNTNAQKNNTTNDGDVQYEIKYPQFESSDFEKNIVLLSKMPIVKKLSGNEFAKTEKPLSERIMDYFNSLNNSVYSDLFGDVSLKNSSMRDDIYGHGRTTQKIIAFAAIPEVIQQGVVIDSQKRGNGNYDRIIVAAPITIGTDKYLMGVMLQRDHQSQRLYLHDVVAINEKETMSSPSTTPFTSEVEGNNDSLYMTTILKKALNVKENDNEVSYSFEITPEQDAEYQRYVESWNKESAQKMVDEKAINKGAVLDENGNPLKLYRGTMGGQTVFAKETTLNGKIYTIDNIDVASKYGDKSGKATEIAHQIKGEKSTYALYGFPKKMLTIDAQYGVWSDLVIPNELLKYADGRYKATNGEIAEWAELEGYDSLRINNVRDGSFDVGNEIIFFDENLVKSADAITYDDNGNIIPLSERFNEDNNDIRYSFEDDVADEVSSLTEQYKNGEISYDEWKSQAASLIGDNGTNKADNPVSIANLSVEAANPTPDLPKRNRANKKGDGDSKLAESIQKSDIFSKEFKDEVVDDDYIKHYDRATNKETMAKAKKLLDEGGSSFVLQWFNKSIDETSTVDVAAGIIMLDRYQKIGDMANALEVAYKLREMATISGQTVQIFSILGRFTPEMMLVYAQHELDKAYETIIKGKTNKWIESNRSKFELTEAEKEFIIRNTLVAATLPEGRDKRIKLAEIASLVQKKTPHKPGDAYKALQRISMLLNPKTNDRNVVGNAIMTPICWIDDLWGACIDNLASKKSGVRTTGNFQFGKETAKAFAQGVYESYDDFIRDINTREINLENSSLGSGKNFNENHTGKVSKYINPISKSLNALDRITSFILDAGDRGFFQMWFINSLNNQLRLNNTTEPTAEMIEIATNDALERTWQDSDNKIVQMFSRFKNALNHISVRGVGLGDWYMKFVKTNANLLRAAIKYSPAGFSKAIYDFVKFNRSLKNGQFDAKIQRKFVNNLSKGITGILLYTIFGFLARAGVISGREDDDKDVAAFEKNVLGIQPYSVKIGDYSFSYTWISPLDSGMAFMADFMDTWENGDSSTFFDKVLEATKSGGQTILDKSVFQSIQNLFKEDDYVSVIVDGILNEVVVFAPQTLSQAASVADDYSRETYEKGDTIKTAINSVKRKIPGLRNTLPESVDVYGEAVENPYDNVWDAFFNPANQLQSNSSPSAEKIYELYQNTKEKSVIPPKAVNKITINGEDITFTSEERTAFQKYRGQLNAKYLDDFTSSSLWEKSSDEEKISIIKDIYSFTNSLAKKHYSSEYELSKKEQKILEYEDFGIMSPIEYFSITTTADKDGNSRVSKSEYAEAVNNTDMSQQQKDLLIGLNEVEGKSDYSKNKTKGFGAGDWYYKENGQYVKITSAAELNRLRRNNIDTYVYTGNYTDVIDELWRAYRGY